MRITGADLQKAGWLVRTIACFTRRGVAKSTGKEVLPDSTLAAAHHPPLMLGVTFMELGQMRMRSVPLRFKLLASLAAARRIGCPF